MNRGFLYGDGFFETMRLESDDIPLLPFHIARAKQTARWLEMDWNSNWDENFFKKYILTHREGNSNVVRVDFYRGGGGLYSPDSNNMEYNFTFRTSALSGWFIQEPVSLQEWERQVQELNYIRARLFYAHKKPITDWARFKSSSALFYIKAGLYLKQLTDVQDLLLVNEKGHVCEGLSSNLIVKYKGKWLSPAISEGPVEGVYLAFLQAFLPIHRCAITMDMLQQSEEVLFVNAAQGVLRIQLVG